MDFGPAVITSSADGMRCTSEAHADNSNDMPPIRLARIGIVRHFRFFKAAASFR
jgi:hypothetical protein